jgi:threonyl-tRNA synthetase
MNDVTITLPDQSERTTPRGTTVRDFASSVLPQSVMKKALAAAVNGRLVDLSFPLEQNASLKIVTPDAPEALHLYRHSTAHLLAAAVTKLVPGAQCGIGPATDEGFFYDFVVPKPFVPEDFERIEAKMRELANQDLPFERQSWPRDEAIAFFRQRGEPLKVQLIEEKTAGDSRLLLHHQGSRDLRRLLRRPACPVHRPAEGVQGAAGVGGLLEGRCAQSAHAAPLWDRLLQGR